MRKPMKFWKLCREGAEIRRLRRPERCVVGHLNARMFHAGGLLFARMMPDLDRTLRPEFTSRVEVLKFLSIAAAAIVLAIVGLFWLLRRRAAASGHHRRAHAFSWMIGLTLSPIAIGAAGLFYMTQIEPNWVVVEHVKIHSPALAPSLKGLRIVQITDLHVMNRIPWRVRRTVSLVKSLRPDVLFITGDFLSRKEGLELCLKAVDKIHRPPYGIWAVPGNTDEIFFHEWEMEPICKAHGVTLLVNQHRTQTWGDRQPFCLAGVNDPTYGRANLQETLDGVPIPLPVLLLAHSPTTRIVTAAAERRVALMLVGHTHGGQMGIPWIRHLSPYADRTPYMAGLFQVQQTQLYVSRGIGTKTRQLRLLCRPEVTLLEVVE